MVQLPSPEELEELKKFDEPFSLAIYAPHIDFDPNGATNPNRIELKNMLTQAQAVLLNDGVEPEVVRDMLRPAHELLDSAEFHSLRSESLALFIHRNFFRHYYLPGDVPYLLSIGRGFGLEPLERALGDNKPYLVLALSHKHVRMFQGDHFTIRELRLKNFPTKMEESLGIDEYPNTSDARRASPASNRRASEITHSEYSESQTDKEMLFLFFRKIDASLRKFLQRKDLPLILAGVGYLVPIYRQANTSPYLVSKSIGGNVEHQSPDELRRHAWSLLKQEGMA